MNKFREIKYVDLICSSLLLKSSTCTNGNGVCAAPFAPAPAPALMPPPPAEVRLNLKRKKTAKSVVASVPQNTSKQVQTASKKL